MPYRYTYASVENYTIAFHDVYATGTTSGTSTATGYINTQYIRIMKSVAGVISEVTNWAVSTSAVIASFRVKTSNTGLTIQAYSDTNLTTQLGSDLTYTVAGATPVGKYGVSLKPSSYNQGYTIASSVNITRN